jgi:hypothetical protein
MKLPSILLSSAFCLLVPLVAQAGLVAQYNFEEGTDSNVGDSSGNGHNGTIQNYTGTEWVTGRVGNYALSLDGLVTSNWVSTASSLASQLGMGGNNAKSVAAWAYTRSFTNGGLFDLGGGGPPDGKEFCLRTAINYETWRVQFWGTPDFDITAYGCASNWTHFVVLHDGTRGVLYQNGFRIGFENSTLNVDDGRALEIGRYGGTYCFDGIIDDFRVYNHALSQQEIQTLAQIRFNSSNRLASAFTLGSTARDQAKGMVMEQLRADGSTLPTVTDADNLLNGPLIPANSSASVVVQTVNFGSTATDFFQPNDTWIGGDNFTVRVRGVLEIPAPGTYSFGVWSDDGFRLRIGTNRVVVSQFPVAKGPGTNSVAVYFEESGLYPMELVYFEFLGGEDLEFSYWAGSVVEPAGSEVLLNNTNAGSICVFQNVLTANQRLAGPAGTTGSEFITGRHVSSNGFSMTSLYTARRLLDGIITPEKDVQEATVSIYTDTPTGGFTDHFAGEFTGVLNVPAGAVHQFTVNSDDGFRLEIGTDYTVVNEANYPKGNGDIPAQVAFLDGGVYPFRLTWFEKDGGQHVEMRIDNMQLDNPSLVVDVYPIAGPKTNLDCYGVSRFEVTCMQTTSAITNLFTAWQVRDGAILATGVTTSYCGVINYYDSTGSGGGNGNFDLDKSFPVDTPSDDTRFIVTAYTYLDIPTNGFWTFGVNSDEGFSLAIGGKVVMQYSGLRTPADTLATVFFPAAGRYRLDLLYFQNDGGSEVELFAAKGIHSAFSGSFHLVGIVTSDNLRIFIPAPIPRGTAILMR